MATLKEIQKVELDMLKAVTAVCDKHNIDYYLSFGTMLGAVRHKGFIPWDDDIDIYVKQKDIKKLKKFCRKELPEKYFWQDQQTDRGVPNLYKRIRNKNTIMYSFRTNPEVEKHKKTEQGVWIDIQPIFKKAKNEKLYNIQIKYMLKYQSIAGEERKLGVIHGNNSLSTLYMKFREIFVYRLKEYVYSHILWLLQSKKSNEWMFLGFYTIGYRDNFEKVKQISDENLLDDILINNKKYYQFEDTQFTGFADYDKYLTATYGKDYMTPVIHSHVSDYSSVFIAESEL